MGRSSAERKAGILVQLDRAAIFGLASGLVTYVMPFWSEGRLRVAFWITLLSTVLHVYTSHRRRPIGHGGPDA